MAQTPNRKCLLLSGSLVDQPGMRSVLEQIGAIKVVDTPDQALEALAADDYDLVISPSTQIIPLARAAGHLRTENFLEELGQGACVVDRDGKMIWANERLKTYSPAIIEAVKNACLDQLRRIDSSSKPSDSAVANIRRRTVSAADDRFFDLTVSARRDEAGRVSQVIGLAWDLTQTKRLQNRIDAIEEAGRELTGLDAQDVAELDVADRLELLEQKITTCCRDLLHFENFIVRIIDKETKRLETVLATGLSEEAKSLELYAEEEGNGVSGFVAATGRSCIVADAQADDRYLPGLPDARSSLTVPLRYHGDVIGVLNVEADRVGAFTDHDRQFAEILGRYIAVALHVLELLAVERHATTGQLAADVDAELAAPLNDILSDVTALIAGHENESDLCADLKRIIDDVDTIKRALHSVTKPKGVAGLVREAELTDPLLDGKRILVADDEDIIRETVSDVLSKHGALVAAARDGAEAIAMIRQQHFDLVLSDIKMPQRNGYEVFAASREKDPDCPVLLVTGFGYDPNHAIVRASKEGLAGVLFKPFKVDQLLEEIRHALTAFHPSE